MHVYDRFTAGAEAAGLSKRREALLGCNCNRATLDAIRAAGFTIVELTRGEFPKAPPFVRPLVLGVAAATPMAPY